jgi:hypothetical protein
LKLCPYDVDIFAFDGIAGNRLSVDVEHDFREGDLVAGVSYYDDSALDFLSITSVQTFDDNELIAWDIPVSGSYWLWIFGLPGNGNSYALSLSQAPSPVCLEDHLWPNNNFNTAVFVDQTTSFSSLAICDPSELDIFSITLEKLQRVYAQASFNNSTGDLDLFLVDSK